MEVRIIESLKDFIDLKSGYLRLIDGHEGLTPFFTHRWLTAWWNAFGEEGRVQIFCLSEQGELLAAIPMMFGRATFAKLSVEKASFLGGNWGLFDFPVNKQCEGWPEAFLAWFFSKESDEWQELQLGPMRPSSTFSRALLDALDGKKVPYKSIERSNPYLPLTGTWEECLAQKSKNFRRTVKRKEREAMEQGGLSAHRIINPTAKDLEKTVSEVSRRSWQGQQGVAVASTKNGQDFYRSLCSLDGEFDIHLSVVYSGDKCVAYLLGLLQNGSYHAFDTGFDPAYADYSPGLVVHFEALKDLFERNLSEFNFGYEHSYKERFEPINRESLEVVILRSNLMNYVGRLADLAKAIVGR